MKVLWVVREGTGLARALNFTITITSSTSTNSAMTPMIQSRKSWNQTMSSITGVADCCSPSSQGDGWPRPAKAAPPPARTVTLMTRKAINRLSTQFSCAPLRSLKKSRRGEPLLPPAAGRDIRHGPARHG